MPHTPLDLNERLRGLGLRMTGPRRVILEVLQAADDHPDVEEIHRRVTAKAKGINLATVYRTLSLLAEHGLIERHSFTDGRARYEAPTQGHHDHFVDTETGEIIEFHSPEIERLQRELAEQHGLEIVSHRLEIFVRRKR